MPSASVAGERTCVAVEAWFAENDRVLASSPRRATETRHAVDAAKLEVARIRATRAWIANASNPPPATLHALQEVEAKAVSRAASLERAFAQLTPALLVHEERVRAARAVCAVRQAVCAEVSPGFFQTNPWRAERITQSVMDHPPKQFSGVREFAQLIEAREALYQQREMSSATLPEANRPWSGPLRAEMLERCAPMAPGRGADAAQTRAAVGAVQSRPTAACAGATSPPFETLGSAVAVQYAGRSLWVTNAHVLAAAGDLRIVTGTGEAVEVATVPFVSTELDLALIEPRHAPGATLSLAAALPAKDVAVRALGYPTYAGDALTLTSGTVLESSVDLRDSVGITRTYVQHTAAIRAANSGGPLLDEAGHVVAINTLLSMADLRIGLSVPASSVALALEREALERTSRRTLRRACFEFLHAMQDDAPVRMIGAYSRAPEGEAAVAIAPLEACRVTGGRALAHLASAWDKHLGASVLACDDVSDASASEGTFTVPMVSGVRLQARVIFAAGRWQLVQLDQVPVR
jgi:S1-C subfamily serine protease